MPQTFTGIVAAVLVAASVADAARAATEAEVERAVNRGLEWLVSHQSRSGSWAAGGDIQYPTAMTALAGTAMLCNGSTAMQGKYAPNIRRAVDFLISQSRPNGLIGDPGRDSHYTYGHGFSMLFLSQVLGEEEDADRRAKIISVLTNAVTFSGRAQTSGGGWGYVSAKDGQNFDEGSTTITQMQGLRGCRNAGVVVPKEIIDKAVRYIKKCTGTDGGVRYMLIQMTQPGGDGGGRPPITAAAVACFYNAGSYDSDYVPKLLNYCRKTINVSKDDGNWHYTHYYYAQVLYREGGKTWETYRDKVFSKIISEAAADGSWNSKISPVFATAVNLTILQLPKGELPIYQR